ncbi:MAG: hypothetical protein NTW72_09815 [Gemmatimonadetes bacterium]|nr:hypothetical protein [Gemmatimonadota bacterium]
MTEPLRPKYVGLLVWVLGMYATSLLPARIDHLALLAVVAGFVVWFVWCCQRQPREIKRQLQAMAVRKRAHRHARVA